MISAQKQPIFKNTNAFNTTKVEADLQDLFIYNYKVIRNTIYARIALQLKPYFKQRKILEILNTIRLTSEEPLDETRLSQLITKYQKGGDQP